MEPVSLFVRTQRVWRRFRSPRDAGSDPESCHRLSKSSDSRCVSFARAGEIVPARHGVVHLGISLRVRNEEYISYVSSGVTERASPSAAIAIRSPVWQHAVRVRRDASLEWQKGDSLFRRTCRTWLHQCCCEDQAQGEDHASYCWSSCPVESSAKHNFTCKLVPLNPVNTFESMFWACMAGTLHPWGYMRSNGNDIDWQMQIVM